MSAPGSGKTTLLERTISDLRGEIALYVVEGDQATSRDADRIRAAGCAAVQINTGAGCHLEGRRPRARPARARSAARSLVFVGERRQPRVPGALRSRRARARGGPRR
jgi:hydrogenase nickel incorporation protein HypB